MPVVRLYYEDLEAMVGLPMKIIMERLPMMGADIGKRAEEDHVDVEFFPDRPDLYSSEGVARALRGFLEVQTGLPEYRVDVGDIVMEVDPSVKEVRPVIGCAVVRGLQFSDPAIESLMDLQEDLHWGLGRDRRKVAIGVHDISRVVPPFRYIAADPNTCFVPLDFTDSISMREILLRHPKGIAYAHILEGMNRFPLIIDSKGQVLSFPPVINGNLTRVQEDTSDLFIDVTGTDHSVFKALNIVVTALAERGGRIEGVRMKADDVQFISPNLSPARWTIDAEEANRLIGTGLDRQSAIACLQKMRFGATPHLGNDTSIEVLVPAYRADIMHAWDIFEDLAKGYGFENIKSSLPKTTTIGMPHPEEIRKSLAREVMAGLGYLETMPFTLTSEKVSYGMMCRKDEGHTSVMHPISEDHTMIRTSILPCLLEILSINQHRPLPQRIFAVGDVIQDEKNVVSLAAASIHSGACFAEIRAVADAVGRELGLNAKVAESEDGAFIPGRGAAIKSEGGDIGCFGEIHPQVIVNFGLEQPIAAMEIFWRS
jgi:phenylalanyl-tRNA synthetase beta chain